MNLFLKSQSGVWEKVTKERPYYIGRDPGNDYPVADDSVSAQQVKIEWNAMGAWFFTALTDKNETRAGGLPLVPQSARPIMNVMTSTLTMGRSTIAFITTEKETVDSSMMGPDPINIDPRLAQERLHNAAGGAYKPALPTQVSSVPSAPTPSPIHNARTVVTAHNPDPCSGEPRQADSGMDLGGRLGRAVEDPMNADPRARGGFANPSPPRGGLTGIGPAKIVPSGSSLFDRTQSLQNFIKWLGLLIILCVAVSIIVGLMYHDCSSK